MDAIHNKKQIEVVCMENKNRFSILLEYLIGTAGLKNYVLAQELQYDVSYISKWVTGKMIPAEKTEKRVLHGISDCIVHAGTKDGLMQLCKDYQVNDIQELEMAIYDNLEAEYNYARENLKDANNDSKEKIRFYPELSLYKYLDKMCHPVLSRVNSLNIMAAIDFMAMRRDYRIQIVNFKEHALAKKRVYPNVHFSLLAKIDIDQWDNVYDTTFLINLLTQLSYVDFSLYSVEQARGKVIFAVENDFALSGMLANQDKCISVVLTEDKDACSTLYHHIETFCSREDMLFRKSNMSEILLNNEYFRSLLSQNLHWLVGHMTEHFLPEDLFEEIIAQLSEHSDDLNENDVTVEQLQTLHQTTKNVLEQSSLWLIFHENAFSDLAVTGELDFFNYKVYLTPQQRIRYLEHLLDLCKLKNDDQEYRIIYGQLVSDFQYFSNQCVFLSDMFSYLRLDTGTDRNNLVIINHQDMRIIFERFYHSVWNNEAGVILSNKESISNYVQHIIQGITLISKME